MEKEERKMGEKNYTENTHCYLHKGDHNNPVFCAKENVACLSYVIRERERERERERGQWKKSFLQHESSSTVGND